MSHVALLRGVNVGGKNKLPMKELAALFTRAGCSHVQTFIQSGNVVFDAPPPLLPTLAATLLSAIEKQYGFRTPVVLRSASQLQHVLRDNPFLQPHTELRTLHVAFLAEKPLAKHAAKLDPNRSPGDTFELRNSEIYLQLPNGVARTKLTNDYFDRTLFTTSTLRNWNTLQKLVELAKTPK